MVDPLPPIENGWLHAPENPGIGTRLRPEVFDRPDVETRVTGVDAMIPGMSDEGWVGVGLYDPNISTDNFSAAMWSDMENIFEFRAQGSRFDEQVDTETDEAQNTGDSE